MDFILYFSVGALSGVLAGLFGIGGGLVITPILIITLTAQGINSDLSTHIALGTSLAVIIFTSINAVLAHNKRGVVNWGIFAWMALGMAGGAFLGAYTASLIPGAHLQQLIGIFVLMMALRLILKLRGSKTPQTAIARPTNHAILIATGIAIGWLSPIFGIAGGMITVPFLLSRGLSMQQSAGTSSACGLPIAIFSSIGYMWSGWGASGLPEWSLGYIYLPALISVAIASSLFARIGVKFAHRLPGNILQLMFAVMLICIGSSFLFGLGK